MRTGETYKHLNYQLIVNGTSTYYQTQKQIANYLNVGLHIIKSKLKIPKRQIRKYKNIDIKINRIKIPINEEYIITNLL